MPAFIALPLIAIIATLLAQYQMFSSAGLSALPLAIVLGIFYGHLFSVKESAFSVFCKQKLLRLGIVLFGFSLCFQQVIAVGWQAIMIDFIVIITVFSIGTFVGIKVLKLHRNLAILTATGSAICGAAAILATESVLKNTQQQHVTIAVASVVLFGTLAMFSYPVIYQFSEMSAQAFGIYIGSTAHEVAQAIAAGQSISTETMQTAIIVKLIRVMFLAPFIFLLGQILCRFEQNEGDEKSTIIFPWFVIGFIIAAMINSLFSIPEAVKTSVHFTSQFSLALAMATLGTQTRWHIIKAAGIRPLLLAGLLFFLLMFGGFFLNIWIN